MKYNSLSNKSCALKNNLKFSKLAFAVLFLGLFFSFSGKANAATYYVDCNAANDDGVGTSEGTAWKTIAKVNATLTGDQSDTNVLFKKDCTWREQLTVPGSGTAGHPFTFGAYGTTGAKPIINGSDIVTSWEQSANWAATPAFEAGGDQSGGYPTEGRNIIPANTFGNSGTKVRITLKAHSSQSSTFNAVTIGAMTTGDVFDSAPTVVTFNNGSASVTVSAGQIIVSDEINFAFDKTKRYGVHVSQATKSTVQDVNYWGYYYAFNSTQSATLDMVSDGTAGSFVYGLNKLEVYSADANIWQAPLTTESKIVMFDGVRGNKKTSTSALASPRDWYWASNVLYTYSASDPDSAYAAIEAGKRDYAFIISSPFSYITVQDITTTKANVAGLVYSVGGTGSNIIFQRCTSSYNGQWGIFFYQYHASQVTSNITVDGCTVFENGRDGIAVTSGNGTDNATIKNNIVHHNNWGTDSNWLAGIHFFGDSDNILVENNAVYSQYDSNPAWPWSPGMGIWLDTVGTNAIVRYNHVYDNTKTGIVVESTPNAQVSYNLVHGNGSRATAGSIDAGILIYRLAGGVKVYNNTVYGNLLGIALQGEDASDRGMIGHVVKNNISVGNTYQNLVATFGAENDGVMGSGNVYLNNDFGPEGSNFIEWGNGVFKSTYNAWETAYGGTTNSVKADPLFTNTAGNDFTLQSSSLAINTGTNVGLTSDYEGNPVPSGLLPDIGAYEYQDVTAPTGGSFTINNNATATNSTSATLNITCPTDSWTPIEMAYGDTLNPTNWETCDTSKAWTLPTGDGTKTVHMRFRDGGLNITSDTTDTIILDTTGPTGSITNDSGDPTNDPTPTFNLTIADAGVGITGAQMRFSGNNSTWSSWESYAGVKTNFNINTGEGCANADGTKKIYVQFKDSLGNVGLAYNTGNFTLDTTASNAALSNTPATQGIYTSSTSANITVGGTDVTSYKYKLDSGSYGDETIVATHLTLSDLAEGSHTLSVIGKDSVGNWQSESDATSYSWTIDTQAPERSDKSPSGILSSGTTSTALSLTTGEVATCKYDTTSKDYGDMNNSFTTADGLSHSATINGLTNSQTYNYYVRCQDTAENTNDTDYLISFSIAAPSNDENTDAQEKAKLDVWSAKLFTDKSSCPEKLKLTIKGHHFENNTQVKIGNDQADSIDRQSGTKLTATFCLVKLLDTKTDHTRKVSVQNPGRDNDRADKQINLDQYLKTTPVETQFIASKDNNGVNNQDAINRVSTEKPNICNYTVESGDTLWRIAQQVYGDTTAYPIIIEKNKDKYPDIESKLLIGQELIFCDNNQLQQNTGSNSNTDNSLPTLPTGRQAGQAGSQQNQTQPQPEPQSSPPAGGFRWWNPFTWF